MLTPQEIASRQFLVSLRGYDREEVHAFLVAVAEQLSDAQQRAADLERQMASLRAEQAAAPVADPAPQSSAVFAEIGTQTQRILEAAHAAGDEIRQSARKEADRELQAARGQATKILAESERRRERVERLVGDLEQARGAVSDQLRAVGRTVEQIVKDLGSDRRPATSGREPLAAEPHEEPGRASGPAPQTHPAPPAETRHDDNGQAATEQLPSAAVAGEPAAGAVDDWESVRVIPGPAPGRGVRAPRATADAEESHGGEGGHAATAAQDAAREQEPAASAESEPPDPHALRAGALSPLHPKLVRKVKRELQEIQNIALDRVRRSKGKGDADSFLPRGEEVSALGAGAGEHLLQAWKAGARSAATLAGTTPREPSDVPDLSGGFGRDAAERVRSGLTATLRMGLSAGEGAQGLSDRIGAVFGEFKGTQAEELAATHLLHAYERGLLAAWSEAGIASRRWVMGQEPRCPEARCRQNGQSGPLPVGQAFPSGHEVPPVHVGCTCTTLPGEPAAARPRPRAGTPETEPAS